TLARRGYGLYCVNCLDRTGEAASALSVKGLHLHLASRAVDETHSQTRLRQDVDRNDAPWRHAQSRPSAASTAFSPLSMSNAREIPRFLARASDLARRSCSRLTEMTFAPRPLRGRPGRRRTRSHQARSSGVSGFDFETTMSFSKSAVSARSSSAVIRAYFATTPFLAFIVLSSDGALSPAWSAHGHESQTPCHRRQSRRSPAAGVRLFPGPRRAACLDQSVSGRASWPP